MIERQPMIDRQPPLLRRELFFSYHGRIKRSTWWGANIVVWVIGIFCIFAAAYSAAIIGDAISVIAMLSVLGVLYWCTFALHAKRWHDRDKSGWWSLISLIPFGGIWVLIELGFMSGTESANRFGLAP